MLNKNLSGRIFQTLYCSEVTAIKSLKCSSKNIHNDFVLKIGILSAKVYTKNVPYIEVCNLTPESPPELCLPS